MEALTDCDTPHAAWWLNQTVDRFNAWEERFSRFRAESELSQLNRHRSGIVSEDLWQVVMAALDAAQLSDGLITPAIGQAVYAAGYRHSFKPGQELTEPEQTSPLGDWHNIQYDPARRFIRLGAGVKLDVAGVAKGWCAQQAVTELGKFAPALVDAGGDIAVSGTLRDGSGWETVIGTHDTPPFAVVRLHCGAVATSGRDIRVWHKNGILQHHIIDPRTGHPAQSDVIRATVFAHDAVLAETAAKTALILGSINGLEWLEQHALHGCLLTEKGWRTTRDFPNQHTPKAHP